MRVMLKPEFNVTGVLPSWEGKFIPFQMLEPENSTAIDTPVLPPLGTDVAKNGTVSAVTSYAGIDQTSAIPDRPPTKLELNWRLSGLATIIPDWRTNILQKALRVIVPPKFMSAFAATALFGGNDKTLVTPINEKASTRLNRFNRDFEVRILLCN